MTDNLDALRAKVVAADAQYLDYEDASLPQERAHYPAVDLIDAQAELITALEAALTASEQARAQAVAALQSALGYIQHVLDLAETEERPPVGSTHYLAIVAMTYAKMDIVKALTGEDLFAKALQEVFANVAPAPNADAEAGGA